MVLFIILGVVVLITFVVLGVLSFLLSQEEQRQKAVRITDFSQLKEQLSSQKQVSLEDEAYKKRAQALENELLAFSKEADGRSNEAKQMIETLNKENESLKSKQSDLEYELIKARAQSSGLERVNFNYKNQLESIKARTPQILLIIVMGCLFSSCVVWNNTVEVGKTIWGSSTRALEQARDRAITRTYDKPYWDCVRSAVAVVGKKHWVIFKKDEMKGYMVVMGVKGCVDTTEIGVFFDKLSDHQTRIEISSLSTNAKRKVAKGLFHGLDIAFGFLPPDPPEPKELPKTDQNTIPMR